MNRIRTLACLCLAGFSLVAQALPSDPPSITEAELVRRTQQLYDAVAPGNQEPWKAFYADDAMVYDEKGRSMDKKALLADLDPMPAGYSGTIKVVHPHTLFAPGVAVLAYECDETETILGQELHARYHSVDTWLYRNGARQIAASQTMRFYEDPAVGSTNPARLDDFAGAYELSSGNRRTVTRQGDDLSLSAAQERRPGCFRRPATCSSVLMWKDGSCFIATPPARWMPSTTGATIRM